MKKQMLTLLTAAWVVFIGWMWFYHHSIREFAGQTVRIQFAQFWDSGTLSAALMPTLAILGIYGLYILWRWMWHGSHRLRFPKFNTALVIGIGFLITLITWNVAAFFRAPPGSEHPILSGRLLFSGNFNFIWRFLLVFLWISVIILAAEAAGTLVRRLFRIEITDRLQRFLFEVALGIGAWFLLIFLLGVVGIYTWWSVLLVAVIFFVFSWRELWESIRSVFTQKWEFESGFADLRIWMFLLLLLMISTNLIDLIRPIPIGWDDLGQYLNKARLIATRGFLAPGGLMFPMELLMSVGYLVRDTAEAAMLVSWTGGFLGSLAIFAFGRRFFSARVGLMAGAIWYTMPMIGHISYADMKVDPMLFFLSAMAIWAFLEWTDDYQKTRWLYLAALITGIAWTVKITTIFLMIGLAVVFLYHAFHWSEKWSIRVKTVFISALIFFIPFVPWLIYNSYTRDWHIPTSIGTATSSKNPDKVEITDDDWEAIGIDKKNDCHGTSQVEELDRYTGHLKGLKKYVRLPWDMTMNTHINDLYLIIGFLFLAFLPAWLLWIKKEKDEQPNPYSRTLLIFTVAYIVFWAWRGYGIPWYGIAMFLPLTIAVATLVYSIQKPRWLHYLLGALVVISIIGNITLRSNRFANYAIIIYSAGQMSASDFIEQILPSYNQIAAEIERGDSRVWRVGTFIPYFIEDNDKRLLGDNQMDNFKCIDTGENDAVTLNRLQKLGFKYMILDLNVATIESDPQGSLHQKANRFVEFANKNLQVLVNNTRRGIAFMRIPDPE